MILIVGIACSTGPPFSLRVLNWLMRTLRWAGDGMAEARRRHQAYEELVALSNPELEDIGISREDIPAVVAGTLRRERTSAVSDVLPITRREGPRPPGVATQLRDPRSKQMCIPTEDEDVAENEVDVRSPASAQRHAKIFELVNELAPGASFILVNDHDPKPLYHQLEAEYPKQFSWTYLERGPGASRSASSRRPLEHPLLRRSLTGRRKFVPDQERPLCADTVEKVENRTPSKISQKCFRSRL